MGDELLAILQRAKNINRVFVPKKIRAKHGLQTWIRFAEAIKLSEIIFDCKTNNNSALTIGDELKLVKRYLDGESTLELSGEHLSHSRIANIVNKFAQTRKRPQAFSLMHKKHYQVKKKQYKIESLYAKYLLKEKILDFRDQEGIALISAFVLTDGWISLNKRKKLKELGFSNTNKELVLAFSDLVFIAFGEAPSCSNLNSKQMCVRYVAPWHQKLIGKVEAFSFELERKTAKKLLKIENTKIIRECIRIAFSCDGYIFPYIATESYGFRAKYYSRIRPDLSLGCKPLGLRKEWKEILEKNEIKSKLEKDRIKIYSWAGLQKFYRFGGFLTQTIIGGDSTYFRGLNKNTIVKRLLYLKEKNLHNYKSDIKDPSYLRNKIINFGENFEI